MKKCKILVYVWFATSKMEFDFWYNKLCVKVASQVTKCLRLKIFGKKGK